MSVDCQARHGDAACQSQHQVLQVCEVERKNGEVKSRWMSCDQKAVDLCVKILGLLFWHRIHAKHVLTGCTNIHGQEIVHCLRVKSFCIEVGKRGGDSMKALFCFFPWRPVRPEQWDQAQCHPEFGSVLQDN